jgi:hypothetical protein
MKTRRKILVAIGIVGALTVLISIAHHYQLRFAVEKYIAELKANGEPMELSQVIPPPVPPEQNSADTFREAALLLEQDKSLLQTNYIYKMRMVAPGKAMICWQQPDARDYNSTNSWEEVSAAIAQNKKALELLRRIIERPALDFQIHYERGLGDAFDFTNLNLASLKKSAAFLSSAAAADLHNGNTASAVTNELAMLALVSAMQNQRFVISELVRFAIVAIAQTVTWETLQSPHVNDEQLAALQNAWARLDFLQGYKNALAMERASSAITLSQWRSSNAELERYFELGRKWRKDMGLADQEESVLSESKRSAKIFIWRYWWSYSDELRGLRGHEALLNAVRYAETNGTYLEAFRRQQEKLDALGITKSNNEYDGMSFSDRTDFHSLLSESIVTLGYAFDKVMTAELAKRAVITVIALKRFQLKHGSYPEKLSELTPQFLSSVQLDTDGQPLRYRRNADGTFLLYSAGENGVDDGGDPALEKGVTSSSFRWQNPHALDWVWPQPATETEIQNFYAHPPK